MRRYEVSSIWLRVKKNLTFHEPFCSCLSQAAFYFFADERNGKTSGCSLQMLFLYFSFQQLGLIFSVSIGCSQYVEACVCVRSWRVLTIECVVVRQSFIMYMSCYRSRMLAVQSSQLQEVLLNPRRRSCKSHDSAHQGCTQNMADFLFSTSTSSSSGALAAPLFRSKHCHRSTKIHTPRYSSRHHVLPRAFFLYFLLIFRTIERPDGRQL